MELQPLSDESYELDEEQNNSLNNNLNSLDDNNSIESLNEPQKGINNIPSGVSIESASYIENNDLNESSFEIEEKNEEEHAPKLFSDEQSTLIEDNQENDEIDHDNRESDQLFDQDISEEEEFEIPAFLRKQKF